MLFEIFVIVVVYNSIQCSLVRDVENQKGIYVSDYCPFMKYCPQGAHVMCMYYDQNNVMGPKCRDPRNVTITTGIANKLLDITNAVRSKVSRGQEKGKNGDHLPRGYGIFRLKWDSELASFAQVLANQCMLRHDFCRATKKFPDPGQTAGIVRFHGSDWVPASKSGNFKTKGLNEEKLVYAITQTLKTWYRQKSHVDIQMVTNIPDWNKNPSNQNGRLYLTLIYGSATHMGCGISAYSEYAYIEQRVSVIYNTVLVICNFSAQPRLGGGVYNTVPPTDTDSSFNACGCPIGSLEDDDCLCLEVPRDPDPNVIFSQKTMQCPSGINCDPTVVVLPIFTVEDAPPDKLVIPERFANESINSMFAGAGRALDSFEELFDNNLSGEKRILRKSRKTLDLQPNGNSNGKRQRPTKHSNGVTVRNRHFEKTNEAIEHKDTNQHDKILKQFQAHMQRPSVFTKTPIFELPGSHYFLSSIKRDVVPRKDFSTGKQLVTKYLYSKNNINIPKQRHALDHSDENSANNMNKNKPTETNNLNTKEQKGNIKHHEEVQFHDILTTDTVLNTAEQKNINHKDSNKINLSEDANKPVTNRATDESDKKFMALLDTLEQEVKHIDLGDEEKEIFDAKIKKIYGKVVGKSRKVLTRSEKTHVDRLKKSNGNTQKTDDEENVVHKLQPSYDTKDYTNYMDEQNYQSKHNTDTEVDDKYSKTDVTDFEPDEIESTMLKIQKSHLNHDGREKHSRKNTDFRQKNRNYLNSLESLRQRYDSVFKGRKAYKNAFRNDFEKLRHRSNSLDYKRNKNYYNNDAYEDILSSERRKYYQDKLDSMERKLQDARRYNRRKDIGLSPHMRAMKSSFRSDNQMNPLYTGRARILHGY